MEKGTGKIDNSNATLDVPYTIEAKQTKIDIEIAVFKYMLDSLCTRELSNNGRLWAKHEIKIRGGNYKR